MALFKPRHFRVRNFFHAISAYITRSVHVYNECDRYRPAFLRPYVATDDVGNTATSTRVVIIEPVSSAKHAALPGTSTIEEAPELP